MQNQCFMKANHIYKGDSLSILKTLPDSSANCIVTSPPYFQLRDYGVKGQLGHEKTPEEFIENIVTVFHECKRVLRADGTLWLNIADTYSQAGKRKLPLPKGYKRKDMLCIPWRVALALQKDGWYLRQDIIWAKGTSGLRREGTVMPEPVKDRCTKAHEYIFLLSKSPTYYFDAEAIKEPAVYKGKSIKNFGDGVKPQNGPEKTYYAKGNRRSVWRINPSQFKGAHFATYPEALIEPCIIAGSPINGIVLDPFMGAGTTAVVAVKNKRKYIGIELNQRYISMAQKRIKAVARTN